MSDTFAQAAAGLSSLPPEILADIVARLDNPSLLAASHACRLLRQLAHAVCLRRLRRHHGGAKGLKRLLGGGRQQADHQPDAAACRCIKTYMDTYSWQLANASSLRAAARLALPDVGDHSLAVSRRHVFVFDRQRQTVVALGRRHLEPKATLLAFKRETFASLTAVHNTLVVVQAGGLSRVSKWVPTRPTDVLPCAGNDLLGVSLFDTATLEHVADLSGLLSAVPGSIKKKNVFVTDVVASKTAIFVNLAAVKNPPSDYIDQEWTVVYDVDTRRPAAERCARPRRVWRVPQADWRPNCLISGRIVANDAYLVRKSINVYPLVVHKLPIGLEKGEQELAAAGLLVNVTKMGRHSVVSLFLHPGESARLYLYGETGILFEETTVSEYFLTLPDPDVSSNVGRKNTPAVLIPAPELAASTTDDNPPDEPADDDDDDEESVDESGFDHAKTCCLYQDKLVKFVSTDPELQPERLLYFDLISRRWNTSVVFEDCGSMVDFELERLDSDGAVMWSRKKKEIVSFQFGWNPKKT